MKTYLKEIFNHQLKSTLTKQKVENNSGDEISSSDSEELVNRV